MIRGTTPLLEFTLPFDVEGLAEVWVTFAQNKKEILTKELCDCEKNGRKLSVHLTQEETLKLTCNCKTEIQLRVKTAAGDALVSEIIKEDTERILKEGAI